MLCWPVYGMQKRSYIVCINSERALQELRNWAERVQTFQPTLSCAHKRCAPCCPKFGNMKSTMLSWCDAVSTTTPAAAVRGKEYTKIEETERHGVAVVYQTTTRQTTTDFTESQAHRCPITCALRKALRQTDDIPFGLLALTYLNWKFSVNWQTGINGQRDGCGRPSSCRPRGCFARSFPTIFIQTHTRTGWNDVYPKAI